MNHDDLMGYIVLLQNILKTGGSVKGLTGYWNRFESFDRNSLVTLLLQ